MDKLFFHDPLIILYYRRFASGNFLANILCHNREFVPKFVFTKENQRCTPNILDLSDEELFAAQLELLKTTIPSSREECLSWINYELSCSDFWAKDPWLFCNAETGEEWQWRVNFRLEPYKLMKRNKRCFIIQHELDYRNDCMTRLFPNATKIQIINDSKTVDLGMRLKSRQYFTDPSLPKIDGAIQFDIDSLWDKDTFFKNVSNLLETLNVKDKTLDSSVDDYYTSYINLYSYL